MAQGSRWEKGKEIQRKKKYNVGFISSLIHNKVGGKVSFHLDVRETQQLSTEKPPPYVNELGSVCLF